MEERFDKVYQFKITLKGINPPIWRWIQIPETYTFWDLHLAIQIAMGWENSHLHKFEMLHYSTGKKVWIGTLTEKAKDLGQEIISEHEQKIADWFSMKNRIADYTYDFGDKWEHEIKLEKILSKDKNMEYPVCIAGERACPPEDCGGIWWYQGLLEVLKNQDHEDYEEILEWVGEEFDPEHFDENEVGLNKLNKRKRFPFE